MALVSAAPLYVTPDTVPVPATSCQAIAETTSTVFIPDTVCDHVNVAPDAANPVLAVPEVVSTVIPGTVVVLVDRDVLELVLEVEVDRDVLVELVLVERLVLELVDEVDVEKLTVVEVLTEVELVDVDFEVLVEDDVELVDVETEVLELVELVDVVVAGGAIYMT